MVQMVVGESRDSQASQTVQDCKACYEACLQAELKCLKGDGSEHEFILVLQAAAGACSMTADSLGRGSDLSGCTAAVSAEVCERFLSHCEPRRQDPVIAACIRHGRRCVEAFRRLGAAARTHCLVLTLIASFVDSPAFWAAV
jgi:hypothetical protein